MISLLDTSFLIPLRIDSDERLENLRIQIQYLLQNFETNILIIEADKKRMIFDLPDSTSIKYLFIQEDSEEFHATRIRNYLTGVCDTNIAALWDVDFIVTVDQILDAVNLLRTESIDVVYPFNGKMYNLDWIVKKVFSLTMNTEIFQLFPLANRLMYGNVSVGGGVFVNLKKYQGIGMENEHIVMWGNDDMERFKRMQKMGLRIHRHHDVAYHLPHPPFNIVQSHIRMNAVVASKIEALKIYSMKVNELTNYIKTWNWV